MEADLRGELARVAQAGRGRPVFTLVGVSFAHSLAREDLAREEMQPLGHEAVAAKRGVIAMRRFAVIVALGGLLSMLGGAVTASPALAGTGARPLNLAAVQLQFTLFECLNDTCSLAHVTVDGKGTSNLSAGAGSYHADLTVDFSPGGTCNISDESATFTFDNGMIFVGSHHEDCATHGLRIDTTFQVTGGTGALASATLRSQDQSARSARDRPRSQRQPV